MSRLIGSALRGGAPSRALALALLALTWLALSASSGARDHRRPAGHPGDEVVLNDLPGQRAAATERPREELSPEDLAAAERATRGSAPVDGGSTDDGISPGAPSDAEVRRDLRELQRAAIGGIPAGPIRRGAGGLIWPVNGAFTSPFGQRWGRLHAGIDIAAPAGKPIRVAASGRVTLMAPTGGYGLYTCVRHRGSISTCYAHQSRFGTAPGALVRQGEVIGYVGNTGHSFGNHLHFEVRIGGRPVDPMGYL